MIRLRLLLPLLFLSASFALAVPPQKTESFWTRVKKFLGVSANPSNQRGDSEVVNDADIRLYNVTTKIGSTLKQGRFRSPIFLPGDKAILALSGNKIVKIEVDTLA